MSGDGLLTGRRAVVTCADAAVGREIVKRFADQGAIVAFGGADGAAGRRLEAEIREISPESLYIPCDSRSAESVAEFCDEVNRRFPEIRILVNSPHSDLSPGLMESDDETERELLQVYQHSIVQTQRAFLEKLWAAGHGSVINISSGEVYCGEFGDAIRTAAYAAVGGMTRVPVIEGSECEVRANEILVAPGAYREEPSPAPLRVSGGRPDVECAADTAVFLASELSSFINGVSIRIDGGASRSLDEAGPFRAS